VVWDGNALVASQALVLIGSTRWSWRCRRYQPSTSSSSSLSSSSSSNSVCHSFTTCFINLEIIYAVCVSPHTFYNRYYTVAHRKTATFILSKYIDWIFNSLWHLHKNIVWKTIAAILTNTDANFAEKQPKVQANVFMGHPVIRESCYLPILTVST